VRSDLLAVVPGVDPAPRLTATNTERRTQMPQQSWSTKRERQYEHIRDGLEERGRPKGESEEIAARTVNKERARSGEAKTASRTSTEDISSGRRGGLRSHRGPGGRTKRQLYEEARHQGVAGRSTMNKAQLERAVNQH
jgi:hypothetical protein